MSTGVHFTVAIALFAVAGAAQRTTTDSSEVVAGVARQRAAWVPYIASALGFGLLIFVERGDPLFPNMSLAITAVVLAILVSVRQLLSQRDLLSTQWQSSYQSLHDALTGLPNRVLVYDRAEQLLARARRQQGSAAALYVDVDGFKQINDTFGHAAGDELLKVVSARLLEVIRESDTVGRLGGDEFVVLLDQAPGDANPEVVADRLLDVLQQPITLAAAGGKSLAITASIGIAFGAQASAEELLRDADLALYAAKAAGKNRSTLFNSKMQTEARDNLEVRMDLDNALHAEQFFLLYQPIFDLETNEMTGIEALIRWSHPSHGIISPEAFIPIAEESGLIVPIGRWVLNTACAQAAVWQRQGYPLNIAVNLSARELDDTNLIDHVQAALGSTGLDPSSLTLEITETALMRDPEAAAQRLQLLKALGVCIALDDFGTGCSSLAYLRQFPVDALKIDRSFISGIAASHESSSALIHTLVQLGKTLGIQTLGEGIEDQAQLHQLQREHCDFGQGYLFARPLQAATITAMLGSIQATPASRADRPSSIFDPSEAL